MQIVRHFLHLLSDAQQLHLREEAGGREEGGRVGRDTMKRKQ